MRFTFRLPGALVALLPLLAAPGALAQNLNRAVNQSIRALRAVQNEDGTYGPASAQPGATSRMLIALGTCEEQYTVFDGPFVRKAVEALLTFQHEKGGFGGAESKDRREQTAEAAIALNVAAPGAHEDAVLAAQTWLRGLELRPVDAGPMIEWALEGRQPDMPFTRAYLRGLSPALAEDPEGRWKGVLAERVLAEQEKALASLTAAGAPEAIDRLLVLIELAAQGERRSSSTSAAASADVPDRAAPKDDAERRQRIQDALAFLEQNQNNGRFGLVEGEDDPGITALALAAAVKTTRKLGIERPAWVEPGFDYLLSLQKPDGAIYQQGLQNYITSAAVEAMSAAGDERFAEPIRKAIGFLTRTQLDEDEGYSAEGDPYYGGFGYGGSEKPDLSNTQMAVQALHDAGLDPQDQTWSKVVGFLARCQNLPESGSPPQESASGQVIVPGDDGGAMYRPANSKAGLEPVGDNRFVARSYGSMTYALLKSYLFAGLDPEDERVKAAVDWIREHYTLEVNPGFLPQDGNARYQGLYYYYLALARALDALGQDAIVDGAGVEHRWREELEAMLFSLQREDGSWKNQRSTRWMEGSPVLATSYSLLALAETR